MTATAITAAPAPGPPPATAATTWHAAAPTLVPAIRHALTGAPERIALLLPALPPPPRRAARLLLAEAARAGDGLLLETAAGEVLLLGCLPEAAGRAAAALGDLGLPSGRRWALDGEETGGLLAWAAQATPAPRPDPERAGVEEAAQAVPLEAVVVRRSVLRLGPGVEPAWLAQRSAVSRRRLAVALGHPLANDPDLLEHAATLMEARLAAASRPEGAVPAPPMLRPGPAEGAPPAAGAIALLPLALAADPAALATRRAALLAAGWGGIGFDGLDAALLGLIDPAGLPPRDLLLLRWSPALGDRMAMAALRGGLGLERVVLTGCDAAAEALVWGLDAGIRQFCGPAVEALVAHARTAPAARP